MSVSEAARALGVSTDAIRKRLSRGQLAGVKVKGQWRVKLDIPVSVKSGQNVETSGQESPVSDAMQATITKQDGEIAFLRARLEASAATIDELITDLRKERQRVDMLEAGRLGMIEARARENEAVGSSVPHETAATPIHTRDAPPAPLSAWGRLLAWLRHDG